MATRIKRSLPGWKPTRPLDTLVAGGLTLKKHPNLNKIKLNKADQMDRPVSGP